MDELHGAGRFVDLLAAGAGAPEEVLDEVGVRDAEARGEGFGGEGGGSVEGE